MDKIQKDFKVIESQRLNSAYSLLKLTPYDGSLLPDILPGQFVEVKIDNSPTTFLRRPISVNFVDRENNHLWILVCRAGDGTNALCDIDESAILNIILPLGNGFSTSQPKHSRILLAGGGVGVAPLLYLGYQLKELGYKPEFLLAAKTADDLLEIDQFKNIGQVHISTDDGSLGAPGLITANPILDLPFEFIYCCGPAPMMKAIAALCRHRGIECEVSLENMMACGIGACLCCVEKTVKGNVCVCTEGPVFNIKQLTWHN